MGHHTPWLKRPPSEIFREQCFVSMEADELTGLRWMIEKDLLGCILWGSDYPHIEGTWPHTAEKLSSAFASVPREECARMLGETAAAVYGFDLEQLGALAAEIGPERGKIGAA